MNILNEETKKKYLPELIDTAQKLPEEYQERLLWAGKGILFTIDSQKNELPAQQA